MLEGGVRIGQQAPSPDALIGLVVSARYRCNNEERSRNSTPKACYRFAIVDIRFGRLMNVKLNGTPAQRGVLFQPVSYSVARLLLGAAAPGSNCLAGLRVLARCNSVRLIFDNVPQLFDDYIGPTVELSVVRRQCSSPLLADIAAGEPVHL